MKLKNEFITLTPANRLYGLKIPVVAITGGIASGKSTIVKYLQDKKLATICADQLVKTIYQKPTSLDFIKATFPQVVDHSNKKFDFSKLRDLAFNDTMILTKLQNFLYPQMEEAFKAALKNFNNPEFILYDIPLLFENKMDRYFDLTILVYCNEATQLKRLIARDSIDQNLAQKMINKQLSIETKKSLTQFIIDNSGELKDSIIAVDQLLSQITE